MRSLDNIILFIYASSFISWLYLVQAVYFMLFCGHMRIYWHMFVPLNYQPRHWIKRIWSSPRLALHFFSLPILSMPKEHSHLVVLPSKDRMVDGRDETQSTFKPLMSTIISTRRRWQWRISACMMKLMILASGKVHNLVGTARFSQPVAIGRLGCHGRYQQ